jgi:hypothetical protein
MGKERGSVSPGHHQEELLEELLAEINVRDWQEANDDQVQEAICKVRLGEQKTEGSRFFAHSRGDLHSCGHNCNWKLHK